jgi:RNA polymerase primary sigma factor
VTSGDGFSAPGGVPSPRRALVKRAWPRANGKGTKNAKRRAASHTLTLAQERALAKRIKKGDRAARDKLIEANLKLVMQIGVDYRNRGVPDEDLVQEGNLGLIRAVERFDPCTHKSRFSSYATFWIRAFMRRAVVEQSSVVRPSEYSRRLRAQSRRETPDLSMGNGPGSSAVEPNRLRQGETTGSSGRPRPKHDPLCFYEFECTSLADLDEEPAVAESGGELEVMAREARVILKGALEWLSPFEAWLIRERYGLEQPSTFRKKRKYTRRGAPDGRRSKAAVPKASPKQAEQPSQSYYNRSFVELACECGLTVHRLRVIERYALDKLRDYLSPEFAPLK